MEKTYKIRKIVRGKAQGEAIVINGSFSFMGDVDLGNAQIIAKGNPAKGHILTDKILIYHETKGSSGGAGVLQTLKRKGIAPASIVTVKPVDFNLTEGAILTQIPFACEPDGDMLAEIKTGDMVVLDADNRTLTVK